MCFAVNHEALTAEMNQQFLTTLNQQGQVYMTPTVYKDMPAIRAAFSNWRTSQADLTIIWEALTTAISSFLMNPSKNGVTLVAPPIYLIVTTKLNHYLAIGMALNKAQNRPSN